MDAQGQRAVGALPFWVIAVAAATAVTMAGVAAVVLGVSSQSLFKLVALTAGLAAAVVWLPLAVTRPSVAISTLIIVDLTNLGSIIEFRGISVYLASLAVAALAVGLALIRGTLRPIWSPVFLFTLVYLAWQGVDLLIVARTGSALSVVAAMARDYVYFALVVLWLSASRRNLFIGAATAVVTLAVISGLSLAQEFVFQNSTTFGGLSKIAAGTEAGVTTARHTGPQGDANFWARDLLLFLPLAVSLFAVDTGRARRWLWGLCTLLICGGIFLTSSRGGFIGAAASVGTWFLLAGRQYRRFLAFAPVAVAALMLVPGIGSRIMTLTQLGEQASAAGKDGAIQERAEAQRVGFAIFGDHPYFGVGPGEFDDARVGYERQLGVLQPLTTGVHNLYLEIGLETGIVGVVTWLLFFGSAVFVTGRAMARARGIRDGPSWELNLLATGALAGLLGWAIASVVLHAAYPRFLYLIMAVGIAADVLARRHESEARAGAWKELTVSPASAHAELWAWVAGTLTFAVLCTPAVVLAARRPWRGTTEAIVSPRPLPDSAQVFPNLELIYTNVIPDMAALAQSPATVAAAVAGLPDPQTQVTAFKPLGTTALRVEATGATRETSSAVSERALARAVAMLDDSTVFEATVLHGGRAQLDRIHQLDGTRLAVGGLVAVAGGAIVGGLTFAGIRRRPEAPSSPGSHPN